MNPIDSSRRQFVKTLMGATAFASAAPAAVVPPVAAASAPSPEHAAAPSSGPEGLWLPASGDSFIRRLARNTNEGGSPMLHVGVSPVTRTVLQFAPARIAELLTPNIVGVRLVLSIATNHNDWGQVDTSTVDAHPLLGDFAEGNGRQSGLPAAEAVRGTGSGVTWNSPADPNVADDRPPLGRHPRRWPGGSFGPPTAAGVVHVNRMTGFVSWDVTRDVHAGVSGWLLRVSDDDSRSIHPPLTPGVDPPVGTVEYYSKDSAEAQADPNLAPSLVFVLASSTPSPSPSPAPAPTPTPSSSPAGTPSVSPTPTPTPSSFPEPTPSVSPTPTPTPSSTPLPMPSPTPTPTPSSFPLPPPSASPVP